MPEQPRERSSSIGVVFLLLVLGFAAAIYFDVGGIGMQLGKLVNVPLTRGQAPPAADPNALPPLIATTAVTQAWYLDASGYDGAETERKATGAPMFVYFHKRGCDACKRVEHELLGSPEVKKALELAVKVRVDVSAGDREAKLAQRFGVGLDLPSLIAIAPDGAARTIALRAGNAPIAPAQLVGSLH